MWKLLATLPLPTKERHEGAGLHNSFSLTGLLKRVAEEGLMPD